MLKIYILATHEEHIEYVQGYCTVNRSPAIMAAEMPPATGSVTSQASTMLRNMDQSTFSRARNRPTNTTEPTCGETDHKYKQSINNLRCKVLSVCLYVRCYLRRLVTIEVRFSKTKRQSPKWNELGDETG